MKKIKLPGNVWRMVHDKKHHQLYLDLRVQDQYQELGKVDLAELALTVKHLTYPEKSELIGAEGDQLHFVEYEDPNDPNQQRYFRLFWTDGKMEEEQSPFIAEEVMVLPQVYMHGTDHHRTVERYMNAELPLSCEYLEWNSHIIISYYLRSGSKFQRHLLILKEGAITDQLLQDQEMKGFSPGAFFVVGDQLIFIKNRNEVCIYHA